MVLNNEGRMDYSTCSMYSNITSEPGSNVTAREVIPCQAGWKFQHDADHASSIVADVIFLKDKIDI